MRWTLRKCDSLLGTLIAAIAGIGFVQLPAFIQQYLQRLGGHVDEARVSLGLVANGPSFTVLDAPARDALAVTLQQRIDELAAGAQAIGDAGAAAQPFVLMREINLDIAHATLTNFQPALPLSLTGMLYGAVGIVAGWLIYEVIKAPLGLARFRRRRHRNVISPAARLEPTLNCDLAD